MDDLVNDLKAELEKDIGMAGVMKPTPFIARPPERTPHQQLEAFMASAAKMLEMQRRDLIRFESDYQVERIRLVDGYRVKIRQLQDECADAVRALDLKHRDNIADAENLLKRLNAMRAVE